MNQNQRNGRRPSADLARGDPVDRSVHVCRLNNPLISESSEKEENDYFDAEHADYGGKHYHGGFQRAYDRRDERRRYDDREGFNFKLKVDIPYFNGSLGIEEFLDLRFFDYMETLGEKRVQLVACRLNRDAFA